MDELNLAQAAAQGDQEAFELLVTRYRSYIYTVAYNISLHEDDALDITQNVFSRLIEKIGSYDGRGSFRAWLASITTRESINHRRRPSRREIATEPRLLAEVVEAGTNGSMAPPVGELERAERRSLVEGAMEQLSPQQRAIFALILFEDMRPKEIAEHLSIPAKQVSWQLHRGLARVREILAGQVA